MKTIEEKAKAYDEALEDMRVIYPNLKGEVKLAVEHAFPQLCESEDEKAKKIIASVFSVAGNRYIQKSERDIVLAYVEKQKQKPMSAAEVLAKAGLKPYKDGNQWCILAGDNIQEGICGFGDTIEDALYEFFERNFRLAERAETLLSL